MLKDVVGFLRPVDLSVGNVPAEAACLAQFLRFGQVSLTPPQLSFRPAPLVNVRKCQRRLNIPQFSPVENSPLSPVEISQVAERFKPGPAPQASALKVRGRISGNLFS